MDDATKIIRDLKTHLEYQKQLGMEFVPSPSAKQPADRQPYPTCLPAGTARGEGAQKIMTLEKIRAEIGNCTRCRLSENRTNIVFGVGNPKANLMFVGEAPGRDEDARGEPFVGRAGQLLNKIIEAMKMKRSDVYIANINKCRPPENRAPLPDEAATCIPFLEKQIVFIKPKIIVCLGSVAVQYLLKTDQKITRLRGIWQEYLGIPVMPTYHPAYLLRNPEMKKPVWEDMQKVISELQARG